MDERDELRVRRIERDLAGVVRATELAYQIPQCTLVQEFLSAHDLQWQAFCMLFTLTRAQQRELGERLIALHEGMVAEKTRLCGEYNVTQPDELPHDRRVLFDAALRAYIEREDHYS